MTKTKNWFEDFSHENGNYTCLCMYCKSEFVGHKRRVVCKECASDKTPEGMSEEIWKDILGFEGLYRISSNGRVKSLGRTKTNTVGRKYVVEEKVLTTFKHYSGYLHINLYSNKIKTIRVHRLVASNFIPNPENKPDVNHKNGVKTDNRVENLEWVTPLENNKHAKDTALWHPPSGEENGHSKVTEKDVMKIRADYKNKTHTPLAMAKIYGLSVGNVWHIIYRHTWKHI